MKAGNLFVIIAAGLTLAACDGNKNKSDDKNSKIEQQVKDAQLIGDTNERTFKGLFPCADCPGIKYELELWNENYATNGTFELEMDYEDRDTEFKQKGVWVTLPTDSAAVIYELTPDSVNQQKMYFLFENENKLTMLDSDKKKI
ncbi:MAG: copper resistance protein NlpE, partial [Bacteroidales bacterium]